MKSGGNITTYGTDMAVVGDNIFMADGNITFGSTLEGAAQNRSAKGRGIGSAEISDTERFYGYYQTKRVATLTSAHIKARSSAVKKAIFKCMQVAIICKKAALYWLMRVKCLLMPNRSKASHMIM